MSDEDDVRPCTKCLKDLPISAYERRGKTGWRRECRDCRREQKRQHRLDNLERYKENDRRRWEDNKEALQEYHREYRNKNRARIQRKRRRQYREEWENYKDKRLWSQYRIDLATFREMEQDQGGVCAICFTEQNTEGHWLCVDHDHSCCSGVRSCGECVRSLLCSSCNQGLARFRDDPTLMERAADYIRTHRGEDAQNQQNFCDPT